MVKVTPREAPGMTEKAFYCGAPGSGTGRSHRARDPDNYRGSHSRVQCRPKAEVSTCLHFPREGLPPIAASPILSSAWVDRPSYVAGGVSAGHGEVVGVA